MIQLNDEAIKAFGVEYLAEMARTILSARTELGIAGIHFYTLNLEESVVRITRAIGLGTTPTASEHQLFVQSQNLLERMNWDEHPNGRFLDVRSPAHGELLGDYYFKSSKTQASGRTNLPFFFPGWRVWRINALKWLFFSKDLDGGAVIEASDIRRHQ
jgi:methylenetetrahydrofolate reductase (NADPH)